MNSKKLEKYFNFNELLRMTGIRILCNSSYDLLRGYRSIDEFINLFPDIPPITSVSSPSAHPIISLLPCIPDTAEH